jgi:hypothetical protein
MRFRVGSVNKGYDNSVDSISMLEINTDRLNRQSVEFEARIKHMENEHLPSN